jgi:6-hydroxycyclohex-1-ene-1-carbonyl-CoA dehydrogenase
MRIESWVMEQAGQPMTRQTRDERPGSAEVIVKVAGCGVCHTDLGFYFDGVKTRHPLPLALGHEISGVVVDAGDQASSWQGASVVVPAVIPCGECPACRAGRGQICPTQVFPGNDVHGGFGSHVRVPALGLCRVPDLANAAVNPTRLTLDALAVVADAVSTPFAAVTRAQVVPGDLTVWVGVGGVGGFGVQVSHAFGADVVAIDVDDARLSQMSSHGAGLALNSAQLDVKSLRKKVREFADTRGIPSWRLKIFEASGHPLGQSLAFGLLGPGATLSVVGYTATPIEIRLSNLMAFDAVAMGNWGCLPELYPAVVDLVLSGKITLAPFIERRPMSAINDVFTELHRGRAHGRIVLIPEA